MNKLEHEKIICPPVNCQYGAPMGGRDDKLTCETPYYLRIVPMSSCGAYDKGGAYWGCSDRARGIYALYCVYNEEGERAYTRAHSRTHAKEILRSYYPDIQFHS